MAQERNSLHNDRSSERSLVISITFWLLFAVSLSHAQSPLRIVNAASIRAEQPVAAGSWVSAFNENIGFPNVSTIDNVTIPLQKTLGGVTVSVDGIPAPLNYVSFAQINFLIPYGVAPGLRPIVVNTSTNTYSGTVRIVSGAPGLFTKDTNTPPRGAILNQDGSENSSTRLAIRGQAISIYATGSGSLDRSVADGEATPRSPLINTISKPQVFIGGVEVPAESVEFSGLAPDWVGLWQINVRIPALSFLSGRLPVQVFMNGVDSNEVTVYVAQ